MAEVTIPIKAIIAMETTSEMVRGFLASVKPEDDIIIEISSPGGSVVEGFEIFNDLKNAKAKSKKTDSNIQR